MYKGSRRLQYLAALLVAALLLSSWYAQIQIKENLLNERAASLQTVLESTHQALLSWYKEQRASATIWANNPRVKAYAERLLKLPHTPSALIHASAQGELRTLLGSVLESRRYQGYFLLAADGISLASSRDENLGTPNLLRDQPHFLKQVVSGKIALSLPQVSDVPLPNARGHKQPGLPTMFVGAPVYGDGGKVIAVFVFRINPLADFTAILRRGAIGDTGESFAFSRSGRLISNSRFEPELRMRGLLKPGDYSMLNVWLRVPPAARAGDGQATGYADSWPLSPMARSGTRGLSGLNVEGFTGYYGEPVISTWLWDDTLQFGIATEMGRDEAYKTIRIIQYTVYVLTGFAVFLLFFFTGYFVFSQRKLRESERRFSAIIDMSDEAIITVDERERITMANRAAQRIFGYRAADLEGKSFAILLPEADRLLHGGFIKAFLASEATMIPRNGQEHIYGRRKGGEVFPMEASVSKQRVGGRMILTVSARDISERLRSEQELRDSERMFRLVFDASEDAILILKDDSFVDCNESTVHMLCAPDKQSVLALHPWELSPEYQPDGQLSEIKAREMIRLAHERHFHRFEWVHRRMDGNDFPVEVTLTTTQIGGRPYLHVMWNDISERKQAELALRESEKMLSMMAEYSSDMISVHDPEGVYRFVSPVCEKLLGYRPEELVGHSAYEFFHPDDLEAIQQSHSTIIETETAYTVVYRIRCRDGGYLWFETASNTVRNEKTGEINEIVAVSRDITPRIQAEQKEEQLQRELMHTQKMEALGRLTGGIAHDFNNILASAKGYTELAMMQAEEHDDEKQLHYLSEVYKSTDRAATVVKQLLAFARGGQTVPSHHLLQEVIEDSLTMMRPLLTARVEIETRLDADVKPVLIDNVQINQVVLNLCLNARDAMEGKGRIEIGVRDAHAGGECSSCHAAIDFDAVELYIRDNGPGMEADHMSRIFDPFYTSKEVGKGSGMGLSVVHGIIHNHGGHIQVESEEGVGTTFHIYFPYAD